MGFFVKVQGFFYNIVKKKKSILINLFGWFNTLDSLPDCLKND
jgi:hypothetical protein